MLSDEWLLRYVKFGKVEHKTLTQCDVNADLGDYNSSTELRTDQLKMDTIEPSFLSDLHQTCMYPGQA